MPAVPADLSISCRWVLPMTFPDEVLEAHTLVVRDGRILDLLPNAAAADRYAATEHVDRSEHALLPGLVDSYAQMAAAAGPLRPDQARDRVLLRIAEMLRGGTTCFCGMGYSPGESARAAAEQGVRALIGIPIAETPSPWAENAGDYLTRALNLRDEYRGHPSITTAFAPQSPTLSESIFAHIATLSDELDAGVLMSLHESRSDVETCLARHGVRPMERIRSMGLLTPALTAANMVHVGEADIALAQAGGIAVTLCPESNLRSGAGPAPVASWARSGLRLGLGSGGKCGASADLWSGLRLLALLSHASGAESASLSPWDALSIATRGGAAALGLDAQIGTLETGKWADLCCVDVQSPAMHPARDPVTRLVFHGTRDLVSDVWVSGRQLLNGAKFTRLDWSELATRVRAWPGRPPTGERS